MQNNTFFNQTRKMKDFVFYFECSQSKKEKYQQAKTKKKLWPNRRSQRITSRNHTLAT
jgi:hypothetical protein